jgi:hypothetical protein
MVLERWRNNESAVGRMLVCAWLADDESAAGRRTTVEPDTVAGNWARSRRDYLTVVSHLSLRTESLLPLLGNPTVTDSEKRWS